MSSYTTYDYYSASYYSDYYAPSASHYTDVVPECDIEGYDCECEPLMPVDPFSRKPVPTNSNYVWYEQDVGAWQ